MTSCMDPPLIDCVSDVMASSATESQSLNLINGEIFFVTIDVSTVSARQIATCTARLIPQSRPSAQFCPLKRPRSGPSARPCPCRLFHPVSARQPTAAQKNPPLVARQLPNSLWPSSSSLPVNQQWIQNAQYSDLQSFCCLCSFFLLVSRRPLTARQTPLSARQSTFSLPVDLLVPFPVLITASVRQHPLAVDTLFPQPAESVDPIVSLPVRPHSLCPSTQSLYLPVDSLALPVDTPRLARRLTLSLCPSTHSRLCPSTHSQFCPSINHCRPKFPPVFARRITPVSPVFPPLPTKCPMKLPVN
ncbi:hypothetical protein OUZ56_024620 [Daphnia magna]|uniref:Uncharacterized protein n=1 Tax=Daphnia magna TaxID=35525 RepID=A0ABR0B1C8_9CRUS|nr:hypothetical protein OUZ56_024620 [Daphnia magna]